MFSMKQAHLYEWIYNKNKELPKEEIYIIALNSNSNDNGGEQTLQLLRTNYLYGNQEITYRGIVKVCIMEKIYKDPQLVELFSDLITENLDLLMYSAILPDSQKANVGKELEKRNFTREEKLEFINCLGYIEQAVDQAIPSNY